MREITVNETVGLFSKCDSFYFITEQNIVLLKDKAKTIKIHMSHESYLKICDKVAKLRAGEGEKKEKKITLCSYLSVKQRELIRKNLDKDLDTICKIARSKKKNTFNYIVECVKNGEFISNKALVSLEDEEMYRLSQKMIISEVARLVGKSKQLTGKRLKDRERREIIIEELKRERYI